MNEDGFEVCFTFSSEDEVQGEINPLIAKAGGKKKKIKSVTFCVSEKKLEEMSCEELGEIYDSAPDAVKPFIERTMRKKGCPARR